MPGKGHMSISKMETEIFAAAEICPIDVSKLQVVKTSDHGLLIPPEKLVFGRNFTGLYV